MLVCRAERTKPREYRGRRTPRPRPSGDNFPAHAGARRARWVTQSCGTGGTSKRYSDEPLAQVRSNHLGFQGGVGFEVRPANHTYVIEMRYPGIPPGGIVPITIGMQF